MKVGSHTFRFLGFFDGTRLILLTNAFAKKTPKIPRRKSN
ncbi:type II toxin-antitoxin system RelE/ParE family toxin [bacterium]|nr:type II toxin-antitoxin system RelE/ParE family toxin [bacterium]